MSNLVEFAKRELTEVGAFDPDSAYDGEIGKAVLELVETFAKQGHSGHSAQLTLLLFKKVANFKPLTPITDNPSEWNEVGPNMWQSVKNYACFSTDGGKSYYNIDDKTPRWREVLRLGRKTYLSVPYNPAAD